VKPAVASGSARLLSSILLGLSIFSVVATRAPAQSTSDQAKDIWPTLSTSIELSPRFRLQGTVENHSGLDGPFEQWELGAILNYQKLRRILRPRSDSDEENRHYVTVGAGYEFVQSNESGTTQREHRIVVQSTPKHSIGLGLLLQDRNRIEFRWKEGKYNFRYRNKLIIDHSVEINGFEFTPYSAGELFWDRNSHTWNENRYAFGARLPFGSRFMLDTFFLHRNCSGCGRPHTNVFGLTLNIYIRHSKS